MSRSQPLQWPPIASSNSLTSNDNHLVIEKPPQKPSAPRPASPTAPPSQEPSTSGFSHLPPGPRNQVCHNCGYTIELAKYLSLHVLCFCKAEICMARGSKWKTCACPLFDPFPSEAEECSHPLDDSCVTWRHSQRPSTFHSISSPVDILSDKGKGKPRPAPPPTQPNSSTTPKGCSRGFFAGLQEDHSGSHSAPQPTSSTMPSRRLSQGPSAPDSAFPVVESLSEQGKTRPITPLPTRPASILDRNCSSSSFADLEEELTQSLSVPGPANFLMPPRKYHAMIQELQQPSSASRPISPITLTVSTLLLIGEFLKHHPRVPYRNGILGHVY